MARSTTTAAGAKGRGGIYALRLQLSYLSKDQALAVADTILRTLKVARLSRDATQVSAARAASLWRTFA